MPASPDAATTAPPETGGKRRAAEAAVLVLAGIGVMAALYVGHTFLVPVVLAAVLAAVLRPLVRRLQAIRVPAPAGAALVVVGGLVILCSVGAALEDPIVAIADEVPRSVAVARAKLTELTQPLKSLTGVRRSAPRGTSRLDTTRGPSSRSPQPSGAPSRTSSRTSSDTSSSGAQGGASPGIANAAGRAFTLTSELLLATVEVLLLLFFLLAAGDAWQRKLAGAIRSSEHRRTALEVAGEMQVAVARYLAVTASINLGQAIVVAAVAWSLDMQSPIVWGALTFIAEFVPYLGGAAMIALLLVAELATGHGVGRALLAPGAYLLITTLQNNLVSPVAYGRGLRLNPAAILVGVAFWWSLWGVAGAFLAVPILASIRILSTRISALEPIGSFLEA